MSTLLVSLPRSFLCIIMFLRGWFLIILTILWLETRKKAPSFNWLTAEGFFFLFINLFLQAPSCSPEENICILLVLDDVLFLLLQSYNLIIQMCDLKQIKRGGFYWVAPPTHDCPGVLCCPLLCGQKRHYITYIKPVLLQDIFMHFYIFLSRFLASSHQNALRWLASNLLQVISHIFPNEKFTLIRPKLAIVVWIQHTVLPTSIDTFVFGEPLFSFVCAPSSVMHYTVWRLTSPAAQRSINNLANLCRHKVPNAGYKFNKIAAHQWLSPI